MPPPFPRPAGSADKPIYAGLAYEVFKILVILAVAAVISATAVNLLHAPSSCAVPSWLQDIYYAANTAVALAAIVALFYAKKQAEAALRQAEISGNASKAEVYQALFQDFISPIFQDGAAEAMRLFLLHEARLRAGLTTQTLGAFCTEQITAMEFSDFQRFRTLINFLTFLESIGLQARRGYLSLDDIFYMLKGPLVGFGSILLDYLEARAVVQEGAWAQAIWLLKSIPHHQPESRLRS